MNPSLSDVDLTPHLTLRNNEILTFLRNAVTASRHRLENPKNATIWSLAFWDELQDWVDRKSITDHDIIFVLANVAHALQDAVMRKENAKCPKQDSRSLLLPTDAT